ncbi:U-box domain-containing protein 11 [Bienertia sinuspersici]
MDVVFTRRKVKNARPGNSSTSASHDVSLRVELSSTAVQDSASNSVEDEDGCSGETEEESTKPNSTSIPVDLLCPISLEIMRDPVSVQWTEGLPDIIVAGAMGLKLYEDWGALLLR